MNYLNKKLKDIKAEEGDYDCGCFSGTRKGDKSYNSNNNGYDSLCEAKLPKGKYLLTFSFLLKASNQWMYLYFGHGGTLMTHCGFYVSTTNKYTSHIVRK